MSYRIKHADTKRENFGPYRYCIYEDDHLIALYWHDYRGDDHGIEFSDGTNEPSPVGRMVDFIQGGGPHPLVLCQRAIAYLKQRKAR